MLQKWFDSRSEVGFGPLIVVMLRERRAEAPLNIGLSQEAKGQSHKVTKKRELLCASS
jgi:hypothetical protein